MRTLSLAISFLLISGCVSTDIHQDYRNVERVSVYSTSCYKPFILTRGCHEDETNPKKNHTVTARIPIDIEGQKIKVAATEDGRTIYIGFLGLEGFARSYGEAWTFGAVDYKRDRLNLVIDIMRDRLEQQGANYVRVLPVTNISQINGYYITSDIDTYSQITDQPKS